MEISCVAPYTGSGIYNVWKAGHGGVRMSPADLRRTAVHLERQLVFTALRYSSVRTGLTRG